MEALQTRLRALALVAVCCVVSAGCGEEQPQAKVSGKVTLAGQPLGEGEVTFFSATGTTGTGAIQPDGTYNLFNPNRQEGIDPGEYIAVVMPSLAQIKKAHGDPMVRVKTNEISPVYTSSGTSPLKYTVEVGSNTIDLVLEKSPKK